MASPAVTALLVALLLGGAALVAGGAVAALQLVRLRRLARAGRLRDGAVALRGSAGRVDATVASPLTGCEALCYAFEVRRAVGEREPLAEGHDGVPFRLETADASVLVDPEGADLALEPTLDVTVGADDLGALERACASVSVDESAGVLRVGEVSLPAGGRYRVVERRLAPGDAVAVTGRARTDAGSADAGGGGAADALVAARSGPLRRLLGVPFVVGDAGPDRAERRLVDRAVVGLLFGLPPALLALVLLFPGP